MTTENETPPGQPLSGASSAENLLAAHLAEQAGRFLRALPDVDLGTLRRVDGALHAFGSLLEPIWAETMRGDLAALVVTLGQERGYSRRLARLLAAVDSLTCTDTTVPTPRTGEAARGAEGGVATEHMVGGLLAHHPGAPKARAMLERQLTLARSRSHTAALQELGSSRFHSLADRMTLLVSDLPLRSPGTAHQPEQLLAYTARLGEALELTVSRLPLQRAAQPYNGDALHRVAVVPAADSPAMAAHEDAAWTRVGAAVRYARYALEVCRPLLGERTEEPLTGLAALAAHLERQQEAADAAEAAALAARTPRITPATAYVLGVVHADQRLEVEAARHAFSVSWPAFHSSGWLTDPWLARST
ncbi:CHAD domain-containing protein [Streptacidiphilus jiangxiensis]|uniref:CHAD domain-containing protein n=1 Tax=Streptacidiphilus jiangxiensis TaxID=235985 RepID=A0A1H7Y021_STRJI|nr:CHAD domain-containing protein [Streptacidiphilus jiangxiensis]SEM39275.1 CHAD domain-containing protein [Streptacidiphilus jiangxiensis]